MDQRACELARAERRGGRFYRPMSLTALLLLLLAAAGHAAWNLLLKQSDERQIVLWLALGIGALALAPALIVEHPSLAPVWPLILASAVAEATYYVLLGAAYGYGDFSVVYPLARGAAPLMLVGWTALMLHQRLRPGGVAGIGVLAVGLALVARPSRESHVAAVPTGAPTAPTERSATPETLARAGPAQRWWTGVVLALGVAFCISAYSAVDGVAMRRAPPAPYTAAVFASSALLIAPILAWRVGWARIAVESRRSWRRAAVVGALMAGAYGLVLIAFRLAPIAYVGAVREVSVVLASLAGWKLLGEGMRPARLVGAALIFVGILCIVVYG